MFKKVLDTPLIMFSTKVLSDFFPSIYAFFPQFSNFLTHFSPNVPFLYHLKMSENLWFSDVFRGYRNGKLGQIELIFALQKTSKYNSFLTQRFHFDWASFLQYACKMFLKTDISCPLIR